MTTLLDRAMEAARGLSPELQDEVARPVLKIADGRRGAGRLDGRRARGDRRVASGGRA